MVGWLLVFEEIRKAGTGGKKGKEGEGKEKWN